MLANDKTPPMVIRPAALTVLSEEMWPLCRGDVEGSDGGARHVQQTTVSQCTSLPGRLRPNQNQVVNVALRSLNDRGLMHSWELPRRPIAET